MKTNRALVNQLVALHIQISSVSDSGKVHSCTLKCTSELPFQIKTGVLVSRITTQVKN